MKSISGLLPLQQKTKLQHRQRSRLSISSRGRQFLSNGSRAEVLVQLFTQPRRRRLMTSVRRKSDANMELLPAVQTKTYFHLVLFRFRRSLHPVCRKFLHPTDLITITTTTATTEWWGNMVCPHPPKVPHYPYHQYRQNKILSPACSPDWQKH